MSSAIAMMMLNGRLDDDVVEPFLDALPASGYRGVCLHPRDGLAVPYGSEQFWAGMERVIRRARERDLAVWFYDEFSFPSGADGGRIVARYPEARARGLRFRRVADPVPDALGNIELGPEDLLALLVIRRDASGRPGEVRDVTGRCGTHRNRWVWSEMYETDYLATFNVRHVPHERAVTTATVFVYQPDTPLAADEELLVVTVEELPARHGEAGLPDVARPEVTDRFLGEVYARYGKFARDFGLEDVPIFQDEVAYQCDHPWNELIESELRDKWGAQWRCRLAGLFEPGGSAWELSRYEYWHVCARLLEQNWFARVAAYCAGHGLRMTGHLPGEESFLGHWRLLGDAFRTLARFDLPGYDVINPPTMDDVHRSQAKGIKLVQSARWLTGGGPMIAEVFGATGFQHDARRARTILAWLALHDIRQPIDHSTWTSAASLRKYDAPPVNTRFNPLDAGRADLFAWHEWFSGLMAEYAFAPEVLVVLPQESLARYRLEERERWAGEVSLLETFFHYLAAASVDVVMVPTERLAEIEVVAEGLELAGHVFGALVVPPVVSLHEDAYRGLDRLAASKRVLWTTEQVTVFGAEQPDGIVRGVAGEACNEAELVRERAEWFHARLALRTEAARAERTVIKSVRQRADGARVLVLANPNEDELEVRFAEVPGTLMEQPGTGRLEFERDGGEGRDGAGWLLRMPGRDVAVIELAESAAAAGPAGPEIATAPGKGTSSVASAPRTGAGLTGSEGVASETGAGAAEAAAPADLVLVAEPGATYRVLGRNCLRLSSGSVELTGHERRDFAPVPVSVLWLLSGVEYRQEGVLALPPHSASPLDPPLQFVAEFPISIDTALSESPRIVLDQESMPFGATVTWDGVPLPAHRQAVFDPDNTIYLPPPDRLGAGEHHLHVTGTVRRADDGLLEPPILVGAFAVTDSHLSPLPSKATVWPVGAPWSDLGMPHGFGPVEYSFRFVVPAEHAGPDWTLHLPEFVGVAEVVLDGVPVARRSWGSHAVALPDVLAAGRHDVLVTVHGSWNNVFSRLNSVTNGLLGPVRLTVSAPGDRLYANA